MIDNKMQFQTIVRRQLALPVTTTRFAG
jgi:hypothetical protein